MRAAARGSHRQTASTSSGPVGRWCHHGTVCALAARRALSSSLRGTRSHNASGAVNDTLQTLIRQDRRHPHNARTTGQEPAVARTPRPNLVQGGRPGPWIPSGTVVTTDANRAVAPLDSAASFPLREAHAGPNLESTEGPLGMDLRGLIRTPHGRTRGRAWLGRVRSWPDEVTTRERRDDQAKELVAAVRPPDRGTQVEALLDESLQPEMVGQCGRQDQPASATRRPWSKAVPIGRGCAIILSDRLLLVVGLIGSSPSQQPGTDGDPIGRLSRSRWVNSSMDWG